MVFIQNLMTAFTTAFLSLGDEAVKIIPQIIAALIFFAIGWVLAVLVEKLVEGAFKTLKVDSLLKSAGIEDVVKRSGHNLNSGLFVGAIVKWFVILVFLIASFDALNLTEVSSFLGDVVNYLPEVIVAVLMLMAGVIVANAMKKIVIASSRTANLKSGELLGSITKWVILVFAVLTALFNLGVAPALIQTVVMAVFAGAALALGLAFGLGGKDAAQKIVERTMKNVGE